MKLLSKKKKQSRMCPQGNCPFQQAAPSAIEIAQGAVTRLRLYPTACVSEPGVWDMAHRLLPHAPVSLLSPIWLIACCMGQWARRLSDFNFRILATLNPAQSPPLTGLVAPCPL
jgi:hypothetical protein